VKVEILIITYAQDIPYLELNLQSIERFAHGFSGVTVVAPSTELRQFNRLKGCKLSFYNRNPKSELWHLVAQVQKCLADEYCPEADFVLHTDSDCMFTEPVSPDDYFVAGKPVMLYDTYDNLPRDIPWKAVVESVLQRPVNYEFMRRHPQVNPIGLYSEFRDCIERLHQMPFQAYVESRKPDFPWGFTEHNIIGAFAYYDPKWHEQYHWHNVATDGFPKEKLIQFWSHSGIDVPQDISHGGRYTPRHYAQRLFKT